jgi:transposase-like protein
MSEKRKSFSTPEEERRFWQMVIETFQTSNLSVKQFCQTEGIAEWSFYHWRKKLRHSLSENPVGEKIIASSEDLPAGSASSFTQIAHVSLESPSMRIEFPSGICLQISNGCTKQLLHDALDCLRC